MGIDISMDTSNVFDNFKKLTPALFSIMTLSGLILFLPQSILHKMALDNLPDSVKMIIGFIFLLSSALTVSIIVFSYMHKAALHRRRKLFLMNKKKMLMQLGDSQKKIIFELLHSNDKKIYLDPNSGDTLYLLNNGFLFQPTQVFSVDYDNNTIMSYTPQPWLLDLFNENPNLFQ